MSYSRYLVVFLVFISYAGVSTAAVHKFEDKTNAKVARLKARQNAASATAGSGVGGAKGNCGGVDIGNVTNQKGSKQAKQEVTVVITGDVVNMGNKCK
ncbi:MAG: hypothetical protein AABY83_04145 [Pseudomonadota bacterium]